MEQFLDLVSYPIHDLESGRGRELVESCRSDLAQRGMFNLYDFVRPAALAKCIGDVRPAIETASFTHKRQHNIYFLPHVPDLAPDHPALRVCETVNHTVCADQIAESLVCRLYHWPPFAAFLAATMDKTGLFAMDDPLAGANVMTYRDGEALNWHFDRSEFTTTLLLQAPDAGGEFQYRSNLRTDDDPNYDGVARLLVGNDPEIQTMPVTAGTLNVFKGKNTAHRVTPVVGPKERIIAVFSYYERPGVRFSDEERIGFYGRAS
ncbi:MAG: 2OG-Fe(II) oxygenase [Hyphomicrobiaceae bacterium]